MEGSSPLEPHSTCTANMDEGEMEHSFMHFIIWVSLKMQVVSPVGEWVNSPRAGVEPQVSKTLFSLGNKFHRNTFKHVPYIKIRYNKENKIIYRYKIFGEIC